jgi:hypothetical protein
MLEVVGIFVVLTLSGFVVLYTLVLFLKKYALFEIYSLRA